MNPAAFVFWIDSAAYNLLKRLALSEYCLGECSLNAAKMGHPKFFEQCSKLAYATRSKQVSLRYAE
jgi:hypothetical protein